MWPKSWNARNNTSHSIILILYIVNSKTIAVNAKTSRFNRAEFMEAKTIAILMALKFDVLIIKVSDLLIEISCQILILSKKKKTWRPNNKICV